MYPKVDLPHHYLLAITNTMIKQGNYDDSSDIERSEASSSTMPWMFGSIGDDIEPLITIGVHKGSVGSTHLNCYV